jgi:hypothetical protein
VSGVDCPQWCTTTGFEHSAHEGVLLEASGVGVTVVGSDTQPTVSVWDQTGILAGAPGARHVRLGADEARLLARVLSALPPEDLIRFAAALAKGAEIVQDATAGRDDR